MKHRTLIAATVLIGICACLHAAPPLADRLPAGTLVYVGWSGAPPLPAESRLAKLLGGADGASLAQSPLGKLLLDKAPPGKRKLIEHAMDIAAIVARRPAALALLDVHQRPDEDPLPMAAVLIDLGKRRPEFARHLDAMLAEVAADLPFKEGTVGDVKVRTTPTPAGPFAMGYIKNVFFAAIGQEVPETLIQTHPDKSLLKDKLFAEAIGAVADKGPLLTVFVNAAGVMDRAAPLIDAELRREGEQVRFRQIVNALGVGNTKAMALAVSLVDRGLHLKMRVMSPAPHRGLLMPFAGKPLTDGDLTDVPADADFVAAANLSVADLLKEVVRVAKEIDPEEAAKIERQLQELVIPPGVSVTDDLVASLGDTWVLSSARSQGGLLTGTLLTVEVKDAKKLAEALGRIERAFQPPPAGEGEAKRGAFAVRTMKTPKVDIRYAAFSGSFVPAAPAWAVHKGRLYVAGWPQVIQAAVENAGADPLIKSAAFTRSRSRIAASPSAVCFANTPKLIGELYPLLLLGWSVGCNAAELPPGMQITMDWLPAMSELMRIMDPEITAISSDKDGLTVESYGSVPAGGLLTAVPALGVSILMPGLSRARFLAKRASSATNVSNIGKAIAMYQAAYRDESPPDFEALIKDGQAPGIFVSPLGNYKGPLVQGKMPACDDYVYIRLPGSAPADLIMVYEKPENHKGKGTIVLFADIHIEVVDMPRFRELLKKTEDWLKANPNRR